MGINSNAPYSVAFSDLSNRPSSWLWKFGDGATSTQQNPTHIYSQADNPYTVSLIVTNSSGTNEKIISNYISAQMCANTAFRILRMPPNPPTYLYYASLQDAYDAAMDNDIIQSHAVTLPQGVNANRNISVILQGGYNCEYSAVLGETSFTGAVTTSAGKLTIGDYILNP